MFSSKQVRDIFYHPNIQYIKITRVGLYIFLLVSMNLVAYKMGVATTIFYLLTYISIILGAL